jgi:hypothetical protein
MDYRAELIAMLDRVLDGTWSVPQFEREYREFFSEDLPDDALTGEDLDFFGAVHEKLEFTGRDPDDNSRRHGWIGYDEFRAWARAQLNQYRRRTGA